MDSEKIPAETKPGHHLVVRVWPPDGRAVAGLWTGKVWWAEGREVFPTHWQEIHGPSGNIWRGPEV